MQKLKLGKPAREQAKHMLDEHHVTKNQSLNQEQLTSGLVAETKHDFYPGDDAVGDVGLHAGAHLDGIRDGYRQERRPRRRPRAL